MSTSRIFSRPFEWRTGLLALTVYGGWLGLTWSFHALPTWVVAPLGAILVAWHGSLQHEAVHGHPTPSRRFNAALAGIPLGLWMPYGLYKRSHIAHHHTPHLTDPIEDPESFYVTPEKWDALSTPSRLLLQANQTLLGRLIVGPALAMGSFFASELRRLGRGDMRHLRDWAAHAVGLVLVVGWLALCGIPLWAYALMIAYPALSLTLVRSFAEHRPAAAPDHRTAIVEDRGFWALLFLHNNLHVVHHDHPRLAWYKLPARYRAEQDAIAERNGGYVFRSYSELFRRYAFRRIGSPVQPPRPSVSGAVAVPAK